MGSVTKRPATPKKSDLDLAAKAAAALQEVISGGGSLDEEGQDAIDKTIQFIITNISMIEDPEEKQMWILRADPHLGNFDRVIRMNDNVTKLVPDEILDGVQGTDREKADTLFNNFMAHFRFKYGGSTPAKVFLATGAGDCASLAEGYVLLLKACGVGSAVKGGYDDFNLVEPCESFGRPGTYSTDERGLNYWVYANHYWAEAEGRKYDLLLKTNTPTGPLPSTFHTKTDAGAFQGVAYYIYSNGACLIRKTEDAKIKDGVKGQGIAFASEELVQQFITGNKV